MIAAKNRPQLAIMAHTPMADPIKENPPVENVLMAVVTRRVFAQTTHVSQCRRPAGCCLLTSRGSRPWAVVASI